MAIKVGINGFGRIGRLVFRVMAERDDFEVVAIHDLADAKALAHLLKYDSAQGRFNGTVDVDGSSIIVNGKKIEIVGGKCGPAEIEWGNVELDVIVESTGFFRTQEVISGHIGKAGCKKVLLTVPAKDAIDATIVMGVNEDSLKASDKTISNASCTTNCLSPVAKVLNDTFGIKEGLMTTVHAYTNDQNVADQIHSDMRRARAAAANIIPTSTGAAVAVGKVIPDLNGKLDGMAMRVPVITGSCVDLVVNTDKEVTVEAVNAAMKAAAEGPMKGVLEYTEDPIVSSDIIHNPHSSIFDAKCTSVMGKNMLKIISWYDNEWGYSNRVVDLIAKAMSL